MAYWNRYSQMMIQKSQTGGRSKEDIDQRKKLDQAFENAKNDCEKKFSTVNTGNIRDYAKYQQERIAYHRRKLHC